LTALRPKPSRRLDALSENALDLVWNFPRQFPWLGELKAMKGSKFTDAQKAFNIRQGEDGTPVKEGCRKAGISQATYHGGKKNAPA
jgi:putative transposase